MDSALALHPGTLRRSVPRDQGLLALFALIEVAGSRDESDGRRLPVQQPS